MRHVLGVVLDNVANPRAPLLSSNTLEWIMTGDENSNFNWVPTSWLNRIKDSRSRISWERAMHSASKVERGFFVWRFDTECNGHPPRLITYQVLDFAHTYFSRPHVPKVLKIFIHISIQLHITIRVKDQTFPLSSNQIEADPLYCIRIILTCILSEHVTLVHFKLDVSPGVSGEIHQHSHNRSIFPRLIKGRPIRVCSQGHCCWWSDILITIYHSHCIHLGHVPSNHGNLGPVPAPVARGCHGTLQTQLLAH